MDEMIQGMLEVQNGTLHLTSMLDSMRVQLVERGWDDLQAQRGAISLMNNIAAQRSG